jgi:hypothetical protein
MRCGLLFWLLKFPALTVDETRRRRGHGNTDEAESPGRDTKERETGRKTRSQKKRLAVEASPENCFVMQRVYVILLS